MKLQLASPLLLLLTLAAAVSGDDFTFDAPDNWQSERIELPPPFAADMTLRGVEELRFAPGMFDAASETFFTYVFVLSVDPDQTLTEPTLQTELLAYYRGLAKAVMKVEDKDVADFAVKLESQRQAELPPPSATDVKQYKATISWTEPFVTRNPQELLLEIQSFRLDGSDRHFVFVSASPQTRTHAIWQQMRQMRQTLRVPAR